MKCNVSWMESRKRKRTSHKNFKTLNKAWTLVFLKIRINILSREKMMIVKYMVVARHVLIPYLTKYFMLRMLYYKTNQHYNAESEKQFLSIQDRFSDNKYSNGISNIKRTEK